MAEYANNDEQLVNEKLRLNLRKMVKSFGSYIKDVDDYEQLEDNLKHMEETDENFHKYDLVEMLSDKIESILGPSIDKNVNETFSCKKFDGDIDAQNKMAQTICANVMKTKEFVDFKETFKGNITKANDNLQKNFQANFIESQNSDELAINDTDKLSVAFTNDFECLSLDNSINQNSFVFFNSEQFPAIALNLDLKKPDSVRLKAIQQMLSIPAGDPQAADHWIDIRKHLLNCLKDPNENIASLCLKLHSRTLASSHYKVSMEIYITLIDHLSEFFKDKELEKRALKTNVEIVLSNENKYLLKIFRLLNDYAKDITSKWTRYPENFIETIITETLKLFITVPEQKFGHYLTPIHFIALLDIQSNWFVKWMHGHDCRRILINSIKKNDSFLQTAVNSVFSYLHSCTKRTDSNQPSSQTRKKSSTGSQNINNNPNYNKNTTTTTRPHSTDVNSRRSTFRKPEIEYAHFVHSINVIRKILCFQNGRNLFPIKLGNKEVSLKDLIKAIIQVIFETSSFKTLNEYSPSKYAYDLLQDLCAAEETCRVCLCNEEVIEQLIKPLRSIMQLNKKPTNIQLASTSSSSISSNSNLYDENCMHIIANVLSKLASTECGYFQLLYNDSQQNFSANFNKNSAANTIVTFVCKALNNQLNYYLSTSEIAEYLYLARLLYSQCQGVFLIKEHDLNRAISESAKLTINKDPAVMMGAGSSYPANQNYSEPNTPRLTNTNYNITFKEMFSFSWSESLLDNLLSMASTPKGVFHLAETGLTGKVISYMFSRYKSRLQVGRYEKFGYGFIISQLAPTPSGCYYLNESGLIQYLIEEIWTELEYGSDDFMSAFPRSYSVEIIDREVYKPMLCLFNILSSFPAVYELLGDIIATPRSFYSIREIPKGLIGLLDRVAFVDKKIKISSLCNYEQSHIFGLRLLSYLQSDLDVLLLLESQYDYSAVLLNLQRVNRPEAAKYDYNNETGHINRESAEQPDDLVAESMASQDVVDTRDIMIDMLSVERNFVLVNANLIGGPLEKVLPPRNTNQNENVKSNGENSNHRFDLRLFDTLPVPSYYMKKQSGASSVQNDKELFELIEKFNYDAVSKNEDSLGKYMKKFRACFSNSIKNVKVNDQAVPLAISQFLQVLLKAEANSLIKCNEFKNMTEFVNKASNVLADIELSSFQLIGVDKAVQYGLQIGQLQKLSKEECVNNLTEVHKVVKNLLTVANKKKVQKNASDQNYSQEDVLPSYDWFVATIFLIFRGDKSSTIKFLYNFHCLKMSAFLWPARLYGNTCLISKVHAIQGISLLIPTVCHYIELILKIELPFIFSAFRMSGLAPSQICSHWLKQFFWNYLNFKDIVMFVSICIVFGVDYMAYFCVSLLKHLNDNQKIVQRHTYRDLQVYLKENQIENFQVEKHVVFMNELEKKYRTLIFDDMRNIFV